MGWETPFRVTVRGVETENRVAALCTVFTLARICPPLGKAADSSGLVDSTAGKVNRAGGSLRLVQPDADFGGETMAPAMLCQ